MQERGLNYKEVSLELGKNAATSSSSWRGTCRPAERGCSVSPGRDPDLPEEDGPPGKGASQPTASDEIPEIDLVGGVSAPAASLR
ncbi:hypothetical protein F2981_16905 [Sinorhizobium meliloti]|nr:hypothetical protein [Sinorhizobium meliloti]